MDNASIGAILPCLPPDYGSEGIQSVQIAHRLRLAESWAIKPGERVLEIGCGQGETTGTLAYLVGPTGLVHGVDIASPDYGSPVTVGAAAAHLRASALGRQIIMEYEVDVLSPTVDFPQQSFDAVVLSHCSWYFQSQRQLTDVFQRARRWAKRLCFAEWDPRMDNLEQLPHLLAVLIRAQYEAFNVASTANIRTLVTPHDALAAAAAAGWSVTTERRIDSPDLPDAKWEISMLPVADPHRPEFASLPDKLRELLASELDLLAQSRRERTVRPLTVFSFVAE